MEQLLTATHLDAKRFKDWLDMAAERQKNDQIFSFIAAWIAFNFYYASYSSNNHYLEFEKWRDQNGKDFGDRSQWLFLINHDEFAKKFSPIFRKHKVLQETIDLPIYKMITKGAVPSNTKPRPYKWQELSDEDIFEVLYQVRNNLFHGEKHIDDPRDRKILEAACNFMIPFLSALISATGK
jgi:hypothetical protein